MLRLAYRLRTKLAPSLYTITPDVGDFAEALVRTGALAEARSVLEQLDDNAGRLQSPFVDIVSARIHGLLEPTNYESWFERALSVASAPLAFEKARTRLALAQRLRRERRNSDAQPQLALALEAFDKLGAQVWAARASAELRALRSNVGRRPTAHRIDALTPQELHVCLTVAEGMTNREVASALFLSPKTVETHLGRAFRKLGLTSRSQLVRMVAERAGDEVHRH